MLQGYVGSSGGGGGSSTDLPVWTFVAGGGNPAAGTFTADNDDLTLTGTLNFAYQPKGDVGNSIANWFESINPSGNSGSGNIAGLTINLTQTATGKTTVFETSGTPSDGGTFISFFESLSHLSGASAIASGDYSVSFQTIGASFDLGTIYANNSITPIADGTYPVSGTLGGSNTYVSAVLIANVQAS